MINPESVGNGPDLTLVRSILEHIERPVALAGPDGRLLIENNLFRHELLRLEIDPADLVVAGHELLGPDGHVLPLPIIHSDLGSSPAMSSQWTWLELPGRLVSLTTLARIVSDRRDRAAVLLRVELRDAMALLHRLGVDRQEAVIETLERRLLRQLPPGSSLCRDSEQRLLALLPGVWDEQQLDGLSSELMGQLAAPLSSGHQTLEPRIRLGWSRSPQDGQSLDQLLEAANADRHPAGSARAAASHHLVEPLAHAIDQSLLDLRYQPIVEMVSGRIQGVEVLCRWRDPRLGTISPCEFIAVAEASEQIHHLGCWLVESVFSQIRRWRDRALSLDYVSINISPLQLHGEGLLKSLCLGLHRHALSASGIMLEMTENQAFETSAAVRRRLWSLHELGFTLAMDDYGTGYSSMQRLTSLPFRALKVDRCLIEAIETDPLQQAMIRGVLELQQATGLRVVVEGVERASQRDRLLDLGCRVGQGFLFSRPITAEALERTVLSGA